MCKRFKCQGLLIQPHSDQDETVSKSQIGDIILISIPPMYTSFLQIHREIQNTITKVKKK